MNFSQILGSEFWVKFWSQKIGILDSGGQNLFLRFSGFWSKMPKMAKNRGFWGVAEKWPKMALPKSDIGRCASDTEPGNLYSI